MRAKSCEAICMVSLRNSSAKAVATCLGLLWLAAAARAADDPGEARFLRHYLCPVGQMLNVIRDTPWKSKEEHGRYLILYPRGEESAYAQCLFFDGGGSVRCEIESPFYAPKNVAVPRARLPAVARLGYDTDASKGNYVREFKLDDEKSPPLAEFMLRSLYEAFLDNPAAVLMFHAPLVKASPPRHACAPTS